MKKFLLFVAAAVMSLTTSAQSTKDIELSAESWGWGWNGTTSYADGVLTFTLTDAWGALSTGWDPAADWSAYSSLTIVFESYTGSSLKVYITDGVENSPNIAEKTLSESISTQTAVTVNFEPSKATVVKQIGLQSANSGDVIKISHVYLTEATNYSTEGKSIAFDQWGQMLASEFDGLSDKAKVVFTVTATGEAVTDGGDSVIGWSIGQLCSINTADAAKVVVADLLLKQIGDNEYAFTMAELKPALSADADQYGRQGLVCGVWGQGKASCQLASVTAYDVDDTATAISTVAAEKSADRSVYSISGQRVSQPRKGLYIVGGRKVLIK